ncbi:hypothetical protein F5B20DRAFT_579435 [Whalleya microplaca]|nr:hypothetical protein F5B20DRAFT_579435 [Whalleya microplaca]
MAPTGGHQSAAASNAKANATTEGWQVAASNSTLNTWIGTRHSWLANAKPVKPTPRPSQPRQPSAAVQITHPVATPPQSASVSVSASAPPRQAHPVHHPPQRPPIQTHLSAAVANTVLPSPAPSDEPSPSVSNSHESPRATNVQSPNSSNGFPTTEAHLVYDGGVDAGGEEPGPNRVSPAGGSPTSRQPHELSVDSVNPKTSTSTNMVLNTPPTPTTTSFTGHSHIAPREQFENPPAKRRRAGNSSVALLEYLRASDTLRSHIAGCGGEQSLEVYIERPRYHLLRDACDDGDLFFITLHQLFCTWAMCQANVHRLCNERVHDLSLVDNAFGIMGTILRSNSKLRRQHLQWFTSFPAPLEDLRNNQTYLNTIRQVLDFLMCVSRQWMVACHNHQLNGYPFLVSELLDSFLLFSPILQAIVFRASRRTLGVADGPISAQMEEMFKEDQQVHRNVEGTLVRQLRSPEYQAYNESLVQKYRSLVAPSRASQGRSQSSQRPASTGPTGTQPQGYHQDSHISPRVRQLSNQATQFMSAPPPSSTSTSPTVPASHFSYGQSPIQSLSNMQALAAVPNGSPHSPVPVPLAFPSNYIPPNTFAATMPPSYTPYYSHNSSVQAQGGHVGVQAQHIPQQVLQYQQRVPGRRHSRQSNGSASASPRLPNALLGQQYNQTLSASHRSSNQQNASGQPMPPMPSARRMSTISSGPLQAPDGNLTPTPLATNAHYATQPMYTPSQSQHQTYPQQPPNAQLQPVAPQNDRLIPPPGMRIGIQDYPHTPYDKRAVDSSLHQAHTRSPRRLPLELDRSGSSERHYQAVKCFVLSPVATPPQPYLHKLKFIMAEEDCARISRDETIRGEYLPVNRYYNGSLRVRVRCCARKQTSDPFPQNIWVTTETSWPEHIFMEINSHAMSIKRRQHHSKDLPVEASSFVVPGENLLSISIPKEVSMPHGYMPYIAIEMIEVLSHSAILDMVKTYGTMPSSQTRNEIKRRLVGSSSKDTDDDDLTMVGDSVSIDLADPFNFSIFKVPVRGDTCTHLECFDLETWLTTRLGKKSCYCGVGSECKRCPKEPSFVDKWKCPLCDGDARPYSLRIDGFLVEVRAQLEKENKLKTKSVFVFADGTWKPNDSGDDDSDIDSDNDANAPTITLGCRSSTNPLQREKPQVEVIELDD